ncbi:MAG: 1-hydroxycarotenoid 3,4-desaturase CrtD [Saprospiraceae bacterium]
MRIGVIGAGIGGLAIAVRLAAKGHEVNIFEANAYPGGKLSEFEIDGYRFDAGPSLFTMPHYVDELFRIAGEDPGAHFQYERLPMVCRYQWENGTVLRAWADPQAFGAEAARVLGVSPDLIPNFLKKSRQKYEGGGHIFLNRSLHRASTWLSAEAVKAAARMGGMDLLSTMNRVHERDLQHPKLVQLFNRFATYNGSDPYQAPGTLTIIPHFEHGIGAFYPRGGMIAITRSVEALARRLGVRIHYEARVEEITLGSGGARGLRVQGMGEIPFDRVVSNMDVLHTFRRLLPQAPQPERALRQPRSTSALIFYWGVRAEFKDLSLHNIFFSGDYPAEFGALAAGDICDDPTVYVNISSKCDPADAPAGCENWFVMINAPANNGAQDWDALIARVRARVIAKLSRMLGRDIAPLIACEAILDPRSIEQKTSSAQGALYGSSSNNRMAAFLRHPNFSSAIKNLYFCGGSVHPGGGIPLCLLSAQITGDLIEQNRSA